MNFQHWSGKCIHLLFLMCPSLIVWCLIYRGSNINISFQEILSGGMYDPLCQFQFLCIATCLLERQLCKSHIYVAWKAPVSAVQGVSAALASPNSSLESSPTDPNQQRFKLSPGSFVTPQNVPGVLPEDLISPFNFCMACIQDSSPSQVFCSLRSFYLPWKEIQ